MTGRPEQPDHFAYYLLGRVTPVRVAFDEAGLVMAAEVPDPVRPGYFCWDGTYLSRLRESDAVETIDREAYDAAVRVYVEAQKRRL
jgi:hypothetical protein